MVSYSLPAILSILSAVYVVPTVRVFVCESNLKQISTSFFNAISKTKIVVGRLHLRLFGIGYWLPGF